jgi:ribosomal protein L3 glutamine methyltransferase
MKPAPNPTTVLQLIQYGAAAFEKAHLWFGHGNDNAFDEAAELVFFAAALKHEDADESYQRALTGAQRDAALGLFERRIRERIPAAYLTRRMWFAGHEFYVDQRVLVPRSPLAEVIDARFEPWIDPAAVHRVLDIGTGSGCIAIASALALPEATVDAADTSTEALAVAAVNVERFNLGSRVRLVRADVFQGLAEQRYDVIISNPPYVGDAEMAELPDEYRREPQSGLHGGGDGLDIVRRILAEAGRRLNPHGVLIVEVGNSEAALIDAFPRAPFIWLEFERGGGGVFLLTAAQLAEHQSDFLTRRE